MMGALLTWVQIDFLVLNGFTCRCSSHDCPSAPSGTFRNARHIQVDGTRRAYKCACSVKGKWRAKEIREMFAENPFLRIEGPGASSESLKSAIANCICPECGGALSLSPDQFRCQGRCGVDWGPVWNRIRESGSSRSERILERQR